MPRRQRRKLENFNPEIYDPDQLRQVVAGLAKSVNSRLYRLEESGLYSWAYDNVKDYLKANKRNYFTSATSKLSDEEIIQEANAMKDFINSRTSTVRGIKNYRDKTIKSFAKRGVNITHGNAASFFDFLNSNAYQTLIKTISSDTVIEDFAQALEEGYGVDYVLQQYKDFLEKGNMTFEQIAEKRKQGGIIL